MTGRWVERLRFTVVGIPKPGGSKTAFYNKTLGRAIIVDASKGAKGWKQTVATFAVEARNDLPKWNGLLNGPLAVRCGYFMPRPQGHYGTGKNAPVLKASAPMFPLGPPDVLKLTRSTEDALTKIVWTDDARIVEEKMAKRYADGRDPGADIVIWEWINT